MSYRSEDSWDSNSSNDHFLLGGGENDSVDSFHSVSESGGGLASLTSSRSNSYRSQDEAQHREDVASQYPMVTKTPATLTYRLETFFFQCFINSVWLHSQADMWRHYLPKVMNTSPALYHSVLSLSALYMYRTGIDTRAKDVALSLYQNTLGHLQRALYDPKVAFDDATLMATVVIGLYELIDKPGHESWCSHSKGTSELMKMRGPMACQTGVGNVLFLTFRGFEVVRAILQLDETFVGDDEWATLTSNPKTIMSSAGLIAPPIESIHTAESRSLPPDYSAVLFMLGGKTANLQAQCIRLAKSGPLSQDTIVQLTTKAKQIEEKLHRWRGSLPQSYNGREKPSLIDASPYASIQEFDSFTMAMQLCFYAGFLLLLHRTIAKYVYQDTHSIPASDQDYARFIVKTAEFMTQGVTTTSLNVTWPVYMASISLRHERERQWTVLLLRTIVREKGWAVANAALQAADIIARKNAARAGQHNAIE